MPQEPANSADGIETMENQLRLSRELKQELVASRIAYATRDLDAIYRHIGAQARLCIQLQQNGETMRAGQNASKNSAATVPWDPQIELRRRELSVEVTAVQQEIRELNCEQLVFVNGSRRTFNMIANAWAGFSPTYDRPAIQPASGGPGSPL